MNRCLFTYQVIKNELYSAEGLKKLNPRLKRLDIFPYDHDQQIREVLKHSGKLSIQGIQPKLSAKLSVKDKNFILVDKGGDFIIKPQVNDYPELPQNEDLTMHLAKLAGFNVPWHGLIKAKDGSLLYVIKRFDRLPRNKKIPQEDFAQLLGATRSTKYQTSMEKVCELIEEFTSFPTLELEKIFKLTLFSFLIGNEDLHLKNFSIQTNPTGVHALTPVYDLVNSTIVLPEAKEELALEMNGKKHGFSKPDFIEYFGPEHCYVTKEKGTKILNDFLILIPEFEKWIRNSFLSERMQNKYLHLLRQRASVLT